MDGEKKYIGRIFFSLNTIAPVFSLMEFVSLKESENGEYIHFKYIQGECIFQRFPLQPHRTYLYVISCRIKKRRDIHRNESCRNI